MLEILTLHEELLANIRHVVPNSDLRSDLDHRNTYMRPARYACPPSGDSPRLLAEPVSMLVHGSIKLSKLEHSGEDALVAEPREVALVAKVFDRMVMSTSTYNLQ